MSARTPTSQPIKRRNFLVRAIIAIQAAMVAAIAGVVGATTLAPAFVRQSNRWLDAIDFDALSNGEPRPVTLRIARDDGYTQAVERTVVYLVRTGDDSVRALQSTCTHLGCRTSFDRTSKRIMCPCHGGVFDVDGTVLEGPPPEPLPALAARVENGRVLVQV